MKKVILTIVAVLMACALPVSVWAQPYTPTMSGDTYGIAQGGGNLLGVPTPRDNNDGLADINDAINLLLGSSHARNSDVDFLQYLGPNSTWRDFSSSDNEGTFLAISLTAANSNTLGIYRVSDPNTDIPLLGPFSGFGFLGSGTEENPFPAALSPLSPGEDFGFYLLSEGNATNRWDSDPSNNVNGLDVVGLDHMLVYHLADLKGKTVVIGFGCDGEPGEMVCESTEEYTFYDPYLITWEDKVLAANGRLGDEDFDDMIYLVDRVAPIPEPISMLLFGSGLAGLVGLRRKQS